MKIANQKTKLEGMEKKQGILWVKDGKFLILKEHCILWSNGDK